MKKLFYAFCCFVCLCAPHLDAVAVPNCPTAAGTTQVQCEAVAGCAWSDFDGCRYCSAGQYYDSSTKKCNDCPGAYPNSDQGTTDGISKCYKNCEEILITGGKKTPQTDDKAFHNEECTYSIECNTNGNHICSNHGYHLNAAGDACISDVSECGNNGLSFYGDNTCYYKTCDSSTTLQRKEQCGDDNYGTCESNTISCSLKLNPSLCKNETNDNNGTITGNATLNTETFSYDYSACICTKATSIENGTGKKQCNFNTDGSMANTNCQTTLAACDSGYCTTDNTTCSIAPLGQYSAGNELNCHTCPAGATTTGTGSTKKSDCHYNNATTFSDKAGSFTLPVGNGNIIINWDWESAD